MKIAEVNEAKLEVDTEGGQLQLEKARASVALCSSGGGSFTAGLLVAEHINAKAGSISIGRLMGNRISIRQQPFNNSPDTAANVMRIVAAYIDEHLTIDSGSAGIEIGTLSSKAAFSNIIAGGSIKIDSFDGRARIQCRAPYHVSPTEASVEVHAQDNMDWLCIKAEGAIKIALSPKLAKEVRLSVAPESVRCDLPEGTHRIPEDLFSAHATAKELGLEEGGGLTNPLIRVETMDNNSEGISVTIESWFDSFRRRTSGSASESTVK